MKVARSVPALRSALAGSPGVVGFVPTMGALHEGHRSLLDAARSSADTVVLSIFVNPLQFGPNEDFATYPRREGRDLDVAEETKVDVAFLPRVEEMYPPGATTTVSVGRLARIVEGRSRPGHFDGVATVVAKLFEQVRPDLAFFGQKDAQQVAVVKRMVADLSMDVEIAVCPTVREPDGLAVSSRNAYLDAAQRERATVLWRALVAGREAFAAGADPAAAEEAMRRLFARERDVALDYALAVDPDTFEPASPGGSVLLVVAATVGTTRLIDNMPVLQERSEDA